MRTRVYIDGLNFYYGALKRTRFKWLNPAKLCDLLLPEFNVQHLEYFTALVLHRYDRPDQRLRQQTYLRALRTLPNLGIVLGRFLTSEVMMPVTGDRSDRTRYVRVVKTEEKGSDVNIASHMLRDGFWWSIRIGRLGHQRFRSHQADSSGCVGGESVKTA